MSVKLDKFMLDSRKKMQRIGSTENYPPCRWTLSMTGRLLVIVVFFIVLSYLYVDVFGCPCAQSHHRRTAHRQADESEYWRKPRLPKYINSLYQDDPRLIEYIQKHWIIPPAALGELSLDRPHEVDRSQAGQSLCVDHLSESKKHGFYVEAGAANGETFSNTLYLERFRNWTGILVEPSPDYFSELLAKKRNAFLINACLSPTTRPMTLNFTVAKLMGSLEDYQEADQRDIIHKPKRYTGTVEVQCFPTYSILKAIGAPTVDYFSLDVVGLEYHVLESLPLEQLDINIFSVEYRIPKDKHASELKMEQIVKYLSTYGYHFAGKMLRLDVMMKRGEIENQDPVCFPQMN